MSRTFPNSYLWNDLSESCPILRRYMVQIVTKVIQRICRKSTNNFDFLKQICLKRVFRVQHKTNEYYHQTQHIWISLDTKFTLKLQFFLDQICPKKVIFGSRKKRKSKHYQHILHVRLSIDVTFHLKQAILIFSTKFAQKVYFPSKAGQIVITTEFSILEFV